ncbi:hypothetical protein BgramDRAFT_0734 [Paraburkholderia graminis C4D1M]|jgi:hypothetical protein|uniref:Uncharacterized protein n=1 Tax=Paraburkholderia graminis (strain ATCC 700544 / DSM 17151 / LMG 18924 / NCIMB 13744 / C4D1M) TaxID=396598 RepID=B1FUB6_PARG4|nr:hypothetical protein BgramDRAFT_0734 [Paraburkholderia graminis C4D1M]
MLYWESGVGARQYIARFVGLTRRRYERKKDDGTTA